MMASSPIIAFAFLLATAPLAVAQSLNADRLLSAAQAGAAKLVEAPSPAVTSSSAAKFAVDGLALGSAVKSDSAAYRAYQCGPSQQFTAFTWCQKTGNERESGHSFGVTSSLLHGQDGRVFYVSRYQAPASLTRKGVDEAITRYTRQFGEPARITKPPQRAGSADSVIALWGQVALEPLDQDSLKIVAEGKSPRKGFLVDHLGNFARSAKEGLPVYRVTGGPGFFWAASFDRAGRGTLRFAAVDASAISSAVSEPAPNPTPAALEANTPVEVNQPKLASVDSVATVAPPVREQAEASPAPQTQAQVPSESAAAEQVEPVKQTAETLDDLSLAQNDPLKLTPEVRTPGRAGNTIGGLIALFAIVAVWHFMKSRRTRREKDEKELADAEPEVALLKLPSAVSASVVPDTAAAGNGERREEAQPSQRLNEGELVNTLAQTLGVEEAPNPPAQLRVAAAPVPVAVVAS